MATVRVNGIDVAYSAEGAGPPVVMLHGASSSAREDWAAQLPSYRKAFRVYLPDARAHAGTRWDVANGFSTELLVADLEAFVDALDLATFHLVGFSLGAITALTYATRHAARLRTLLIAGIDTEREPRTSVARHLMDPARIEREEPAWAAQLERRHGPVQGPGAWKRLMRALAADVATQPVLGPAELRAVRVPTLMTYGDRDVFAPLPHVVDLYRQLPQARLLVAPACDHQVMVSRPALFNDAAAAFYRETEAEARARSAGGPSPAASTMRSASRAPIPTSLPAITEATPKEARS
jgi:pimeloyl-ACP methyl ester carboxylesterase